MDAVTIEKYGKGNEAAFVAYVKDAFHPKYILSDPRFLGWQFDTLYIAIYNSSHLYYPHSARQLLAFLLAW